MSQTQADDKAPFTRGGHGGKITDLQIINKPAAEYEQKGKGGGFTTDQMPGTAFAERYMEVLEACRETVPLP